MGVFDRIRSALGGSGDPDGERGEPGTEAWEGQPGIDRGAGTDRVGVDPDDDRKTGAHGAHWEALVPTEELRAATVEAVEEGDRVPGRAVDGRSVEGYYHPSGSQVRTCAVAVDGVLATAYPSGAGIVHSATVTEVVDWANGIEAQIAVEVGGRRAGVFDAGYFARDREYAPGDEVDLELAAFAYELDAAADEGELDPDAGPAEGPGVFVGFDGGDVDDYLFRARVRDASRHRYRDRTVRRVRVPFVGDEVDVPVYAGEDAISGDPPQPDEEIEGVIWLQGRVVG